MLCGLQVALKFLFGRVLGLMSSQRSLEYRLLSLLKIHPQAY
jgi:hypothetical protein